jgi:hypothetical protein
MKVGRFAIAVVTVALMSVACTEGATLPAPNTTSASWTPTTLTRSDRARAAIANGWQCTPNTVCAFTVDWGSDRTVGSFAGRVCELLPFMGFDQTVRRLAASSMTGPGFEFDESAVLVRAVIDAGYC